MQLSRPVKCDFFGQFSNTVRHHHLQCVSKAQRAKVFIRQSKVTVMLECNSNTTTILLLLTSHISPSDGLFCSSTKATASSTICLLAKHLFSTSSGFPKTSELALQNMHPHYSKTPIFVPKMIFNLYIFLKYQPKPNIT